jgi:tetratricopeptide (TPR) repeat protein
VREAALDALREDPRDRFSVGVAVLAVITAVVAAGVGILFATSSNRAEEATSEALRHALNAASESNRSAQAVDRALQLLEQRRESAARARYAHERLLRSGRTVTSALQAEEARWARLAGRADRALQRHASETGVRDISAAGSGGPDREPYFPINLRARAQRDGLVDIALRDAANTESSAWSKRSASYAAILTMLAVALYLFGFALTPQGRALRGLFASVGTAFLALCIIFGPVRALSSPELASADVAEAAEAYADGVVASTVADGPESYEAATRRLSDAIELVPGFAEAYNDRSFSRILADSPQNVDFVSLTSPKALSQSIQDLRMARALGVRTASVVGDLGFHLFELGLLEDDPELLEESVELTRDSIDEAPGEPVFRFNLGVALLGLGQTEAAHDAYREAVTLVLRQRDSDLLLGWVSGALTDLELVSTYGPPDVLDEAQTMRELIIGSVDRRRLGAGTSDAVATRISASVEPGVAEFYIDGSDGLEANDMVHAHWYHLEPGALSWSHLQQISIAQRLSRLDSGALSYFSEYTRNARACLPSGRYRVDLYENGRLLGRAETEYEGGFESFVNHDIGVVGCILPDWRPEPADDGPVRAYLSPDGERGLLLIRLDRVDPPPFIDSAGEAHAAVDNLLSILGDRALSPTRYLGPSPFAFLNGSFPRVRYSYGTGEILAGAATDTDGSLVGALVFGPRAFFAGRTDTPTQIVSSLSLLTNSAVPGA